MVDLDNLHEDDEFECPKCKGTGYRIWENEQGYSMASPCDCSAERKFLRSMRLSRLPKEEYLQKRLENFRTTELWQQEMKELAEKFLADKNARGIGYFGNSGTGKTFICIGICLELLKRGKIHKYFAFRNEINKLLGLKYDDPSEYRRQVNLWSEVPYLYIDDLWKDSVSEKGSISRGELQTMYEIINNRYLSHKPTLFSSEYTIKAMRPFDDAIASRIYEMCAPYGYVCKGNNQRFAKAVRD